MLDFLIDRALRKHNEETVRRGDDATDEEVLEVTQHFFQCAFDYALACRNGFAEYDAVLRRKIKESGLTEVEYHKARQVSREHNLERYSVSVYNPWLRTLLTCVGRHWYCWSEGSLQRSNRQGHRGSLQEGWGCRQRRKALVLLRH